MNNKIIGISIIVIVIVLVLYYYSASTSTPTSTPTSNTTPTTPTSTTSLSRFTAYPQLDNYGNDISNYEPISQEAAAGVCYANPSCTGFTYTGVNPTGKAYYKNKNGSLTPFANDPGKDSGYFSRN